MIQILEPSLGITADLKRRLATIRAKCKVTLSHIEECIMKNCPDGLWFRIECELREVEWDQPTNRVLLSLGMADVTVATVQAPFEFSRENISTAVLNEDPGTFVDVVGGVPVPGQDELIARFRVINLFSNTEVASAFSNEWRGVYV